MKNGTPKKSTSDNSIHSITSRMQQLSLNPKTQSEIRSITIDLIKTIQHTEPGKQNEQAFKILEHYKHYFQDPKILEMIIAFLFQHLQDLETVFKEQCKPTDKQFYLYEFNKAAQRVNILHFFLNEVINIPKIDDMKALGQIPDRLLFNFWENLKFAFKQTCTPFFNGTLPVGEYHLFLNKIFLYKKLLNSHWDLYMTMLDPIKHKITKGLPLSEFDNLIKPQIWKTHLHRVSYDALYAYVTNLINYNKGYEVIQEANTAYQELFHQSEDLIKLSGIEIAQAHSDLRVLQEKITSLIEVYKKGNSDFCSLFQEFYMDLVLFETKFDEAYDNLTDHSALHPSSSNQLTMELKSNINKMLISLKNDSDELSVKDRFGMTISFMYQLTQSFTTERYSIFPDMIHLLEEWQKFITTKDVLPIQKLVSEKLQHYIDKLASPQKLTIELPVEKEFIIDYLQKEKNVNIKESTKQQAFAKSKIQPQNKRKDRRHNDRQFQKLFQKLTKVANAHEPGMLNKAGEELLSKHKESFQDIVFILCIMHAVADDWEQDVSAKIKTLTPSPKKPLSPYQEMDQRQRNLRKHSEHVNFLFFFRYHILPLSNKNDLGDISDRSLYMLWTYINHVYDESSQLFFENQLPIGENSSILAKMELCQNLIHVIGHEFESFIASVLEKNNNFLDEDFKKFVRENLWATYKQFVKIQVNHARIQFYSGNIEVTQTLIKARSELNNLKKHEKKIISFNPSLTEKAKTDINHFEDELKILEEDLQKETLSQYKDQNTIFCTLQNSETAFNLMLSSLYERLTKKNQIYLSNGECIDLINVLESYNQKLILANKSSGISFTKEINIRLNESLELITNLKLPFYKEETLNLLFKVHDLLTLWKAYFNISEPKITNKLILEKLDHFINDLNKMRKKISSLPSSTFISKPELGIESSQSTNRTNKANNQNNVQFVDQEPFKIEPAKGQSINEQLGKPLIFITQQKPNYLSYQPSYTKQNPTKQSQNKKTKRALEEEKLERKIKAMTVNEGDEEKIEVIKQDDDNLVNVKDDDIKVDDVKIDDIKVDDVKIDDIKTDNIKMNNVTKNEKLNAKPNKAEHTIEHSPVQILSEEDNFQQLIENIDELLKHDPNYILHIIDKSVLLEKQLPYSCIKSMKKHENMLGSINLRNYLNHLSALFLKGHAKASFEAVIKCELIRSLVPPLTDKNTIYPFDLSVELSQFINDKLNDIDNTSIEERKFISVYLILGLLVLPRTNCNLSNADAILEDFCQHYSDKASIVDLNCLKHAVNSALKGYLSEFQKLYGKPEKPKSPQNLQIFDNSKIELSANAPEFNPVFTQYYVYKVANSNNAVLNNNQIESYVNTNRYRTNQNNKNYYSFK